MAAENAIEIKDVTKIYRLYEQPIDRLKESLNIGKKQYHRDFYALSRISFSVEKGQTVGIIGTNGSGKSTILKIITGVLTPTSGEVMVNGKISALLELGAGFNMDYTGIENIYMNGTMMGFSRREMEDKLQDILDFADIGDFVYQPVKTYSSGMFVRLAFAVAINIEPEILIVDEALSVGDVFFQAKCFRKFEEFREMGKTLLMVSHDLSSISKYSDKVILLNQGTMVDEGEPKYIVDLYKRFLVHQEGNQEEEKKQKEEAAATTPEEQEAAKKAAEEQKEQEVAGLALETGSGFRMNPNVLEYGEKRAEITGVAIYDEKGLCTNTLEKGTRFRIAMQVKFHEEVREPICAYTIKDARGTEITGTNTMYEQSDIKPKKPGDVITVTFEQELNLQGGEYLLSFGCTGYRDADFHVYHRLYDACSLTVVSTKNTVGFFDMNSKVTIEE